jgi:hypothetical protein
VERDFNTYRAKDMSRSIDYLETRPDIDMRRLAYCGFSLGAFWGPILTHVDGRFKASVLLIGGLSPWIPLPEVDAGKLSFAEPHADAAHRRQDGLPGSCGEP